MSKIIIIRGPLGIGKSTISTELRNKLNGFYISIDEVLSKNDLDKMPEGENIPVSHFIKANELIIDEVKNNLNKNIDVIVDGNFYYKESLEHLVNNFKNDCIIFTLKASVEVCIQRDKNRPKSYGEGSTRYVYSLVDRFDYGINIDIEELNVEQSVNKIIKELNLHYK